MEKFDISKAIEEEVPEGEEIVEPLDPKEFKKILKRASSPDVKPPGKLTEEKIKNLRRRIQNEPPERGRRERAA